MANTRSGSSPTKQSTTAKEKQDLENAGQLLGQALTLKKTDVLFLATSSIEAARMLSVRDGSPDPDQFRKNYKMIEALYEDLA